jgi:hypothetical protein
MRQYMLYKIKGDFFDCQLYKDFLYIWDMDGVLSLYDWNAIKETIGLVAENRANYNVYGNIKAFQRFRKGFPVEVVGGLFPTDTAFVGGYLYTAVETGLYKGAAIIDSYRRSKFFTSSKPAKVWDCPPLSLASNTNRMQLAISTGEEGLFELNSSKSVKTKGLVRVHKDIYSVSKKKAIRSRYVKGSIFSTDENLEKYYHEFRVQRKINGETERAYVQEYDYASIVGEKWPMLAGTEQFTSISRITKKGVEVYPVYKKQKSLRQKPFIELEGTKRKLMSVEPVSVGNIIEYENGMMVFSRQREELVRINTPVTRWRWYQEGSQKLLFVILDDYLEIYEF